MRGEVKNKITYKITAINNPTKNKLTETTSDHAKMCSSLIASATEHQ